MLGQYFTVPRRIHLTRHLPEMRSLIARFILLVLAMSWGVRAAEPVVFPTISFDNLSKDRLTLPADFKGNRNLLLLYFDLTQQRDIDDWNTIVDRWRASDPSLASYTLLVSPQKNFLSRWWQNASMRSASPDASRWPTTLPIYVNKRAFERKLGIPSEKQVILLLMDREGHVLNRVSGAPTDSTRDALQSALTASGSTTLPAPAPSTTASPH